MTDRFIDSARIQRLQFLEAHLFRYSKEQYEKEQDRIQVYCAKNPKEEVDFAAQKIRKSGLGQEDTVIGRLQSLQVT